MAIYFYTDKNGKRTSVTGGQLGGLIAGGVIRPGTVVSSEDGTPLIVGDGGILMPINTPPKTTRIQDDGAGEESDRTTPGRAVFWLIASVLVGIWGFSSGSPVHALLGIIVIVAGIGYFLVDLVKMIKK